MLSLWGFVFLSPFLSTMVISGPELLAFWVGLVFVQLSAQQVLLGFPGATNNFHEVD